MKNFRNPLSFLLFSCVFLSNALAEETKVWIFNVTVDGNPIGEHRFKKTFRSEKTVIESIDNEYLRTGDKGIVNFRFKYRPEFIEKDDILIFREGKTKGIGRITDVEED